MELLIIKTDTRYIRVRPDGFFVVNLDKASVFPMDRLDHVRALEHQIQARGFKKVRVKKLILTEEAIT